MTDPHLPDRRTTSWPPVLRMEDVAALIGLQSARAARQFVVRRDIPHIKEGRRILVLLETLLAWLKSKEQVSARGARVRSALDALRGSRSGVAEAVRRTRAAPS